MPYRPRRGFRGRYFALFAGLGFRGSGALAFTSSTIHPESRSVSVTPAAIAGLIPSVLCTRQKSVGPVALRRSIRRRRFDAGFAALHGLPCPPRRNRPRRAYIN